MSPDAKNYNDSALGSRSNLETKKGQAPSLLRTDKDGKMSVIRFDGQDGDILIDKKVSIFTSQKTKNQAVRQSQALEQNNMMGRLEVPTPYQARRANTLLNDLGIKNITVKVVPHGQ